MVGIFQYIPQNSHPGPHPFFDVDLSLALPSRWHLRIGGSPTPQGPLRREAAPRKTARARRGGTTAPREDGKHGAGQRRVEQRKI